MNKIILLLLLTLTSLSISAQQMTTEQRTAYLRNQNQQIDSRAIRHFELPEAKAKSNAKAKVSASAATEEEEFIFDPEGTEKMYSMTMYSYSQTQGSFSNASSLKSQVRYAADGKTVYFKDITKSLGVKTWLKGEIDGDTIRIPYGQPLVYYKSKYLVFFVPMIYHDTTGEMEAQDEYKLIVKGDSLLSPTYEEGTFQAATGYVYISETTQGSLSLDLDHRMCLVNKQSVVVPEDATNTEYVYTYLSSRDKTTKTKVNVKQKANDLYMQISTSAPNAYIHGIIDGDSISIPGEQLITDSTFLYFYTMADAVYEDGELTDFVPAVNTKKFAWHEADKSITSSKDVFGVDYMSGMEYCMDYTQNQQLNVYPGDVPAKPMAPIFSSIDAENSKYVYFNLPALDVDSTYINQDLMSYRVYFDDQLYTFEPGTYMFLSESMTDVPWNYADNFDFYHWGQLHEFYFYEDFKKIGIQSVYTVDGIENCSDITEYTIEDEPVDPSETHDYDIALSGRLANEMVTADEPMKIIVKVMNNGEKDVEGYEMTCKVGDFESYTESTDTLSKGEGEYAVAFAMPAQMEPANRLPIYLSIKAYGDVNDEVPENNVDTLYDSVYDQTFCKNKVLLEEFTSEYCGWCPYGAYRIKTALDEEDLNDEIIWICHHDGFSTDWLTNPVSTELLALYGPSTFAPAWTLNRNVNYSDKHDTGYPVFSIPTEIADVKTVLSEALNEPCFVNVDVESKCADGKATITVKAEKNASFDGQCPTPMVSVFVLEDSITPHNQKCYDEHTLLYHNNVLRDVLTPTWGQTFEWNGDEAQIDFAYDIPKEYKLKDLKVVAFIHEYNEDINRRKVYNVARTRLADDEYIAEKVESIDNEQLTNDNAIYNLSGQKVSSMHKGVYIVNGKKIIK